jgi:hypothetical protein
MIKLLKLYSKDTRGVMLLALLLFVPLFWLMLGMTLDGTNARYIATSTKTALNRAVKAAVLPLDEEQLAQEITRLDSNRAKNNFYEVLRKNLKLTQDLSPTELSIILEAPEILDLYICQDSNLPKTYNSVLGISHTFYDPGVLAVVKVKHKYVFTGREQDIYVYSVAEVKD